MLSEASQIADQLGVIANSISTPPHSVSKLHPAFQLIYTWQGVLVPIITAVGAASIAVYQINKQIISARNQYFDSILQDQEGIIRATYGELSSVIYYLFDLYFFLESDKRRDNVLIFPDTDVFKANAGRVGKKTGRAFGMLSVYYRRVRQLAQEIERNSADQPSADFQNDVLVTIGHGALVRFYLKTVPTESFNKRLSEVDDSEFDESIKGFTVRERKLIKDGRALWLEQIQREGRT